MINANDARLFGQNNLVILKEIRAIEEAILTAVNNNLLFAVVNDNTIMTNSTPIITVTGDIIDPFIITTNSSFDINSTDVVEITTADTLNTVIDKINGLKINGITASKSDVNGPLIITSHNYSNYMTLSGTNNEDALTQIGLTAGNYSADRTSQEYYEVWQNEKTNATYIQQIETVIEYFNNLGYKISIKDNEYNVRTFEWYITW